MEVYTIGFTQKSAESFFELLKKNKIELLVDVRLNTKSQLAGFAKERDLPYFLKQICSIEYIHELEYAPEDKLLSEYKKGVVSWDEYVSEYRLMLIKRNAEIIFHTKYKDRYKKICFLCSEATPEKCHRRLLAEYLKGYAEVTGVENIVHI